MGYGSPLTSFNANATPLETAALFPPYNSTLPMDHSFPKAAPVLPTSTGVVMKSDSGITYNLPIPRKRPRDHHHHHHHHHHPHSSTSNTLNRFVSYPSSQVQNNSQKNCGCNLYFLGEDISIQIQQQQMDLDLLISQHQMEKVRMEVEEKRKREARRIMEVIELGMMRILRSKEEEIEKMGKLNWELEERVNCLSMENQIWRDVAETNEATANALRRNLEEVLLLQEKTTVVVVEEEVAESCCEGGGGGTEEDDERRMRKKKRKEEEDGGGGGEEEERRCKKCGKEESCVLLLPCRHLCLCTVCASSLHNCPICNSTNNASVRVILP
ncbi:probable BOI-related E3 ubiquitin-protein ligase 2 isoform X1 [Cucumis melo]|uniref:Probable BOI-related E3 ubiquitin-protein ligase 2 isoform X1 n=1 Tax=Cucumis melo TaxID=3656 RepID=A0A1S3C331_CUCME|nr:probable BOI-related E3 ubiquitin-protein ligase 2 isoform X1 [Cucumis melo]